jgi:hypothetical protein
MYKGINLTARKIFSQEARRIQWTRAKFMMMWFDNWESQLVPLGFATHKDGAKAIDILAEQLTLILNFHKTALTLNGSGTAAGRRPKVIFYNPHLPLVGKAISKEGAMSTMIIGSSAACKAIPPHFQFSMTAQHKENEQCQMEAAAFFPKRMRQIWNG